MKLLLISDTHGSSKEVGDLVQQYVDEVQYVCHMGDFFRDLMKYEHTYKEMYPNLKVVCITGNCDFSSIVSDECILEIPVGDGIVRRILMVHGHNHTVKLDRKRLAKYALQQGVDACFYGHTHEPTIETIDSIFIMNPGSLTEPRGGSKASYGFVEISEDGAITGKIVEATKGDSK